MVRQICGGAVSEGQMGPVDLKRAPARRREVRPTLATSERGVGSVVRARRPPSVSRRCSPKVAGPSRANYRHPANENPAYRRGLVSSRATLKHTLAAVSYVEFAGQ
jgi:hypothetical protein